MVPIAVVALSVVDPFEMPLEESPGCHGGRDSAVGRPEA